ncbi:hypothetical protein ZWY2020_051878 [Hordeum vulgare]|nr:hypothetical protein ZWY2020_051878 [Hordeum vulgare]
MAERKRETAAGISAKVASVKMAAAATPKAGAVDSGAQWGGWLRASPGKSKTGKEYVGGQATSKNSSSGDGWTGDSEEGSFNHSGGRREAPTKRNLSADFLRSVDSRTGVGLRTDRGEDNIQLGRARNSAIGGEGDLRQGIEQRREHHLREKLMEQRQQGHDSGVESSGNKGKTNMSEPCTNYVRRDTRLVGSREGAARKKGTYVKKPRLDHTSLKPGSSNAAFMRDNRKRGPRQVWIAKDGAGRQGTEEALIRDTRRKTSTVFDRISGENVSSADPAGQGRQTS